MKTLLNIKFMSAKLSEELVLYFWNKESAYHQKHVSSSNSMYCR